MLDLDCKRDEALSEYQLALTVRDGQQDTRLAAERGDDLANEIALGMVKPVHNADGGIFINVAHLLRPFDLYVVPNS